VAIVASLKTQLDEQKRRADSLEQANSAIKDKVDKLLAVLRAQGWQPGMMGVGPVTGQPQMSPQMQQPMQQPPSGQYMMQQQQPGTDLNAIVGEVFPASQNKAGSPGVNPVAPGAYGQY